MYELMIVATTNASDSLLLRVEKVLKEAEAKDIKIERFGKKLLAYTIRKQSEANYFILNFNASPGSVKPICDKLRLEQEDLLRYLLIREKEVKKKAKVLKKKEAALEEIREMPKVTVVTKTAVSKVKTSKAKVSQKKETSAKKPKKKGKK